MNEIERDHERARQLAWLQAWCATAGASNCIAKTAADSWADHCLKSFDTRFPRPAIGEPQK